MGLNLQKLSYPRIGYVADEFLNKYHPSFAFAGNVLVPKIALIQEVEKRLGKIPEEKFLPEEIFPVSQELLDAFKVSGEVLSRRLGKEGVIKFNS